MSFRDPLQLQSSQPPLYSPPPPPYTAQPTQSPDGCHAPQGYTIMVRVEWGGGGRKGRTREGGGRGRGGGMRGAVDFHAAG